MITVVRTDSSDASFVGLVRLLDTELAERDGPDHAFYAQFNRVDALRHVVVAYDEGQAVACGAMKSFAPGPPWDLTSSPGTMEIKRMYTLPESRGHGFATRVLRELESWAREMSVNRCVLETGRWLPGAIATYTKNGYTRIPNYGQYEGVESSVCFEKML